MLHDLLEAGPYLSSIGAGVALLWYLGRDRDGTADEYTVDDYRPALDPTRRDWPLLGVDTAPAGRRWLRPGALTALADPAGSGTTPLMARRLLVDMAVPTRSDAEVAEAAARMLREIAAEQRAGAVAR